MTSKILKKIDTSDLTPLTPEVMSKQATLNIGVIGHVAHGKSTLVKTISEVSTVRFAAEKAANMTIKLGYANTKVWKNDDEEEPYCYISSPSWKDKDMTLMRHISFVDCPGHDKFMKTMLKGTSIMDAALLVIAVNESCPQPQTIEHLKAINYMGLRNIIIIQNKIDLVDAEHAMNHYKQIKKFLKGTIAKNSPIVPVSAQFGAGISCLLEMIVKTFTIPTRDFDSSSYMTIVRSFDINRPDQDIAQLNGGVAGGTLSRGIIQIDEDIEIKPGILQKDVNGEIVAFPIRTKVVDIRSEKSQPKFAVPGGLIAICTNMDPTLTKQDRLAGNILGKVGTLPNIYSIIDINIEEEINIRKKEPLVLTINNLYTKGKIIKRKDKANSIQIQIKMDLPVCVNINDEVSISHIIDGHLERIGYGIVISGVLTKIQKPK